MTEEKEKKSRATNIALGKARRARNDEFYTLRKSVEDELQHYHTRNYSHFAGKIVYCNCDDPRVSEFYRYFKNNFSFFGLKKLLTTCYKSRNPDMFSRYDSERAVFIEYGGGDSEVRDFLQSDGDFRSPECIDLLRQADIVVTNPPFSLFREYVPQLVAENKKFLVIGNMSAIHYREIFPLIMAGKLWLGISPRSMEFKIPDGGTKCINAVWFTNLDHKKRHEELILTAEYGDGSAYPKYDNYDAINVNRVADIPCDYAGIMGVPDTFLEKWNPEQFELVGIDHQVHTGLLKHLANPEWKGKLDAGYVGGERKYSRILIKHKGA